MGINHPLQAYPASDNSVSDDVQSYELTTRSTGSGYGAATFAPSRRVSLGYRLDNWPPQRGGPALRLTNETSPLRYISSRAHDAARTRGTSRPLQTSRGLVRGRPTAARRSASCVSPPSLPRRCRSSRGGRI